MTFNTEPNNAKPNTKPKENYFLSQPHQPFFVLGLINAVIMMLLFALAYKGVLSLQMSILGFHVYSLVFLLFLNVFTGFLFTTFPKFNLTEIVDKSYYTKIFYANVAGSILFVLSSIFFQEGILVAMLIVFISQIFIVLKLKSIYDISTSATKVDSFWMLIASYFGVFGNALFILSQFSSEFEASAISVSFFLFVIFLTFSVAYRMVPAFSGSTAPRNKYFIPISLILFTALSLFSALGFQIGEVLVNLALFVYLLREFLRWKLNPFNSPAILWILHLALFWLPASFLLSAISISAEIFLQTTFFFLGIHLLALGFLTTILIGFGTRVVMGHSGQVIKADKTAINIFYFTQLLVLVRTLYSINIGLGWNLGFLFDISFTLWVVLFIIWAIKYARTLILGKKPTPVVWKT